MVANMSLLSEIIERLRVAFTCGFTDGDVRDQDVDVDDDDSDDDEDDDEDDDDDDDDVRRGRIGTPLQALYAVGSAGSRRDIRHCRRKAAEHPRKRIPTRRTHVSLFLSAKMQEPLVSFSQPFLGLESLFFARLCLRKARIIKTFLTFSLVS
jgi:hypothetical protein